MDERCIERTGGIKVGEDLVFVHIDIYHQGFILFEDADDVSVCVEVHCLSIILDIVETKSTASYVINSLLMIAYANSLRD